VKKNYIENLKEITKEELFDGLLGYGMFAEKIPLFLTSENFLEFCKKPPKEFTFGNKPRKYIIYESMRNINIPRTLSIPHPIAYRNQCKILSDNWCRLLVYFKNMTKENFYKISRIHIRKILNDLKIFELDYKEYHIELLFEEHLFEMNHKNFYFDDYPEPKLLIGKKYLVKADISNCFPSIYSHALPWALVGKNKAKKSKVNNTKWYNKIDELTRNKKEAETHGILIGPHSSNLVSEIILVAVDNILSKKYRYLRNIDDYSCYVKSMEEAEQFLIDLSSELKKYNLALNHKKTEILELPLASSEHWVRKLNTFVFSDDKKINLKEVRAFLDIALDLMKKNKENSAILNYAIKVLSKKDMTWNAKEYFIDTIHHLVLLYPYLVTILDEKVFKIYKVEVNRIEKIANDIFNIGENKKLFEAMSYAVYFAIKYNFKLKYNVYDIAEKNRDAVFMLLAYLYDKKLSKTKDFNRSAVGKKYKELAKNLLNDIDEYWIFVYEVLTVGLLKDEWKAMKKAQISFVKNGFI